MTDEKNKVTDEEYQFSATEPDVSSVYGEQDKSNPSDNHLSGTINNLLRRVALAVVALILVFLAGYKLFSGSSSEEASDEQQSEQVEQASFNQEQQNEAQETSANVALLQQRLASSENEINEINASLSGMGNDSIVNLDNKLSALTVVITNLTNQVQQQPK